MNIRYVCAQPANDYYLWQVETIINNFMKNGVNPNHIDILLAIDNNVIPPKWVKMRDHYNYVRFFFYNDTRESKTYIPAIYFNLMKHHLVHHPELSNEVLFLHDSDIVFTKPVDFRAMTIDNTWYLSDTNSYINHSYIQQKGDHIYTKMCDIIGIDKLIPKLMNSNSGGAQYIVKNTNFGFWDKVEKDSIKLYEYFCETEHLYIKKHNYDYPIQKWTAGMWSLLWNAWLFGHETKVDKQLDFGWSTNHISDVEKYSILHNSGVTSGSEGLFYKGEYTNKLPYNIYPELDKDKASYFYWLQVQEASLKSPLL